MKNSMKRHSNRFMSVLLSLCMILGMLPMTATAAEITPENMTGTTVGVNAENNTATEIQTITGTPYDPNAGIMLFSTSPIDIDDETTWGTPDVQTPGSNGNVIYMYVDFRIKDTPIRAKHQCVEGATVADTIVKATATTPGSVTYTCDKCGAISTINIPALDVNAAFTMDDESKNMIDNGIEYNGGNYTITYEVADAYQKYIGNTLTNNISLQDAGTYHFTITIDNAVYNNVQMQPDDELTIRPKTIQWSDPIQNIIYDGTTSLLGTTNPFTYTDVNGQQQPCDVYIHPLYKNEANELVADENTDTSIGNPIDAGFYQLLVRIPDTNYKWVVEGQDGTYSGVKTNHLIMPDLGSIFVNDNIDDVTMEAGNSPYFEWQKVGIGDTSSPGNIAFILTLYSIKDGNKTAMNNMRTNIQVNSRKVTATPTINKTGSLGCSMRDLGLPDTITVTAENLAGTGKQVTNVPVTWNINDFDSSKTQQTLIGTLGVDQVAELNTNGLTTVSASVTLSAQAVTAPTINNYSKTYDGYSKDMPLPAKTTGIYNIKVTNYAGTTLAGQTYSSTTAPTEAGNYTATVEFEMMNGYTQLSPVTASYTITQATQDCPDPILTAFTDTTLTFKAVTGAKYSLDGTLWQDSNVFTELTANTTYTIHQYLPATADYNYAKSTVKTASVTTGKTTATVPPFNTQTYQYDGNTKQYQLPTPPEGTSTIAWMESMGLSAITITSYNTTNLQAPTNVGNYIVTITVTPDENHQLTKTVYTTNLTIEKGYQTAPNVTINDLTIGFTSIKAPGITGAEYSIDNGTTWQPSSEFTGLTSDTEYTLQIRMAETDNLYASDVTTLTVTTNNNQLSEGNAYVTPTTPQVYDYDGNGHAFDTTGIVLNTTAIQQCVVSKYTGTTAAGKPYNSSSAPISAGEYQAIIKLYAADGYTLDKNTFTGTLIINQLQQTCPDPILSSATNNTIIVEPVYGAEYSLDGITWQSSNKFTGLTANTEYKIYQRKAQSEDSNFAASDIKTAIFRTALDSLTNLTFSPQSYQYDGNTKEYILPSMPPNIETMVITGYNTADGSAPTQVGTYRVTIEVTPDSDHTIDQTTYTANLSITKAPQNPPSLTTADITATDTVITVTSVAGAEYSINNGATWQSSNVFIGLTADTNYTVLARMAETDNFYASSNVTLAITTSMKSAGNGTDYAVPTTPQVYQYDGDPKPYDVTGIVLNNEAIAKCIVTRYNGTASNNRPYNSSQAPTYAGSYTVTITLTPNVGYTLDTTTITGQLIIEKAPKVMENAPVITQTTTTSILVENVTDAKYSLDGTTWQDSTIFDGLNPGTEYTIYQYYPESTNYLASNITSTNVSLLPDADRDGIPDDLDPDDDNDGIPDINDPDHPDCIDPDTDGDGLPDSIDTDDDNDGILDVHDPDNADYKGPHPTDINPADHICDICGNTVSNCADTDDDHLCDVCGNTLTECLDANKNHLCDICGKTLSACADDNNDHNCDYCGTTISDCEDKNLDHKCDICGKTLSQHIDADNDHTCDYCNKTITDCADNNHDHICDICGKTLSQHIDADSDHVCDYCSKTITDCVDDNHDHICDICGATLSQHKDTNNDHACDYCEAVISDCLDENHDHLCDICGATLSQHKDTNNDHNCDYCGASITDCVDNNHDHKCDTCGKTISGHNDTNDDHICDECGKTITDCIDNNHDHVCDICDTILSQHDDTNNDHKCDYCKAVISDCLDENHDHLCDICGKTISNHADTNNDHLCDECGETLTGHTDTNNDHICDTCGKTMTGHEDADNDHICDDCGKTITDHEDADNDHHCDICDKEITVHTDADHDHLCDICGEKLSDHMDNDNNGECDICGEKLIDPNAIHVKVTNYATNAIYNKPDTGWVTGENTLSVTSSTACRVVLYREGQYTEIKSHQIDENTYGFTASLQDNDELIIVLVGDTDLNGYVSIADMTRINQYLAGLYDFNFLNYLTGDSDLNSYVSIADMTRINQYLAGLYTFQWNLL